MLPAENANDYSFTVAATNKAGVSEESPASAAVRVYGRPAPVGSVGAAPNNGAATLTFDAPPDGGQAIQRYEVQVNGSGASTLADNRVVSGLNNGTSYTFAVRACNTYCGQWSPPSNAVVPFGPPGAPGQVNASGSWKNVSFSWSTAPENGRPINRYEVNVDNTGWQSVGMATSYGPVGDGYRQTHSIQVRAVDSEGTAGEARGNQANTSFPSVTVSKGGRYYNANTCWDPSCGYIVVTISGIQPGTYRITYGSNAPGGGDLNGSPQSITANGDGNGQVNGPKFFGYPDYQVWAFVDGIESNHYTWPR
jgi:hypothetical protein